jgi:hypothetical protein
MMVTNFSLQGELTVARPSKYSWVGSKIYYKNILSKKHSSQREMEGMESQFPQVTTCEFIVCPSRGLLMEL